MTIDRELLAAYADGELGPDEVARVEAAIAADPALAAEVDAHRQLRATLSSHFAPILDMPVPDQLSAALKTSSNVVDLGEVRRAREATRSLSNIPSRWVMGGAIAASLVVGVMLGGQLPTGAPSSSNGGQLIASGPLDKALTTQLASAGGRAPVRVLLSFKAGDGRFCRAFEAPALSGIACRDDKNWTILRTQAGGTQSHADYRQAGSAAAALMAEAQAMAPGGALDEQAERAARDGGWAPKTR